MKIDDKGLRIMAGDKNKRVAVVIDENGIRVEKNPPEAQKSEAQKLMPTQTSPVSPSRKTGAR